LLLVGEMVMTLATLGRAGAYDQYVIELLIVTMLYLLQTGGLRVPATPGWLASTQLAIVLVYGPAHVFFHVVPRARASLAAVAPIHELLRSVPGPIVSQQGSFSLFTRGEIHIQLFHFASLARLGMWDQTPFIDEIDRGRLAWIVTQFPL